MLSLLWYVVLCACGRFVAIFSAFAKGHGYGAFDARAPFPARARGPFMTVQVTGGALAFTSPCLETFFFLLFFFSYSKRHRPVRLPGIILSQSLALRHRRPCRTTCHDTEHVIARPSSLVELLTIEVTGTRASPSPAPLCGEGSQSMRVGDRPQR